VSNIKYAGNTTLPGREAFLYVAGSNLDEGAWRIYSLANPASPTLVSRNPRGVSFRNYMHDSTRLLVTDARTTQCVAGHDPCELMIDFNVENVDLWDVTDKAQPVHLASATYPNARYIHSGWPTADGRSVIVHDELDEVQIAGLATSIYTLDISDLRAPVFVATFTGGTTITDHNGYTVADRYYVSHYKRGLVIFDVTNPRSLREAAWFDTYLLPNANTAGTEGAWGVYPFLPSGTLLVSDIENGLFLLKRNETQSTPTPPPPAPTPPPAAAPGGGGGGAFGFAALAVLSALAFTRIRRRAGTMPGPSSDLRSRIAPCRRRAAFPSRCSPAFSAPGRPPS
jgi:choice-of-anchor B domain-containing protein